MIGIGLVGYGYWGPNLARNFSANAGCKLVAICELDEKRAGAAKVAFPQTQILSDFTRLIAHPEVQAIVIATAVTSHFPLAKQALVAGKDVWIEKPITLTAAEAEELVQIANDGRRILAVDHTFIFTGAVQKIKEIIDSGEIGSVIYYDSVRTNLGLFQSDVNVIYDLAPHEFSILSYLLGKEPSSIQAMGASHAGNDIENLAYIHLEYPENLVAHFHLNWLAPVKLRRTLIGGTKKMIVYDDMEPTEKVKIYDKGITVKKDDVSAIHKLKIDYRTGDMLAPKLKHGEALAGAVEEFASCIRERRQPISDGISGLKVMRLLDAAQFSIRNKGARVVIK